VQAGGEAGGGISAARRRAFGFDTLAAASGAIMVHASPVLYEIDEIEVPAAAIVENHLGQPFVWVMDAATYRIEPCRVGLREQRGTTVRVTGGLLVGERIVAAGARQLSAGMVIRPYRVGMLSE